MGKFLLSFLFALISNAGDLQKTPPAFVNGDKKFIFVDFEKAEYNIAFDITTQKTMVHSVIRFATIENGFPLFDSVHAPTKSFLDGEVVQTAGVIDPTNQTAYIGINKMVPAGTHVLEVDTPLLTGVKYDATGVRSGFFMSDLDDRQFLELYVPANLEYDQFQMVFNVTVKGAVTEHEFFTNGMVKNISNNQWQITYPSRYVSSSIYFHMAPKGAFRVISDRFKSVDGRSISVTVYGIGSDLQNFQFKAKKVFDELEMDYGPWLHNSLTIYAGPIDGGMEYCGATITNLWALGHEMAHSYFARGFMPANGNSGWMDEAIASWRDNGYPQQSSLTDHTDMANQSPYLRITDYRAYNAGARFIAHLDYLSQANGGLKLFLKNLAQTHSFDPAFTQDFQGLLESFNGKSLQNEFNQGVYGYAGNDKPTKRRSPFHPKLTQKQLDNLL